ncbi:ATP-binding protein [Lacrimispora sp.]|uniref:ATP-binding protein n=1 Tax=Lacrimispora sp. TaxID=2719234 RepID=UPI00289C0454|nr:DUF87 domain-containing protein [Lacrimispora sp.]
MIKLGEIRNSSVYFNSEDSFNEHILILGKSGTGKTVLAERLFLEVIKAGGTIIAIDLHHALNADQIPKEFRKEFIEATNEIEAYDSGIPCPLFTPIQLDDQKNESSIDTVSAVTNVLAQALQLRLRQKSVLKNAVEYVHTNHLYEERGISALREPLLSDSTDSAADVANKLEEVMEHNIFVDGGLFIQKNKINIIRLSQFDLKTQVTVAEIILAYIWRLASSRGIRYEKLYVGIDEFQNLSLGNQSTIARLLSEGRKFNTSLMLITQSLSMCFESSEQKRLMQSALQVYFRPSGNESRSIARLLDPYNAGTWERLLRGLQIGEFIGNGPLLVNKTRLEQPLKISSRISTTAKVPEAVKNNYLGK